MKIVAENKRGKFDYLVHEDWEAGIVLTGPEIKAIRSKRLSISGSYVKPMLTNGVAELWWLGGHLNVSDGDPVRSRKLLLNKVEINRIVGKLAAGNYTIIPLELYFRKNHAKLKIGLASRKTKQDRRETLKKRDVQKNLREQIRQRKTS